MGVGLQRRIKGIRGDGMGWDGGGSGESVGAEVSVPIVVRTR